MAYTLSTPGNDFAAFGRKKEVVREKSVSLKDPQSILAAAKLHKPDLIDVCQDDALAAGTVDLLKANGFAAFGPTKAASRIEWDKQWSREFMRRNRVPMPQFRYFEEAAPAKEYVKALYGTDPSRVLYIKAAGLCAGKGALKATTEAEAFARIDQMASFGEAGRVFLVEEGLVGEEFSYYAISDGAHFRFFKSAQDNKTVDEFDEGDQTGGMGAVSPAKVAQEMREEIEHAQVGRALDGMANEGIPYVGILYLGGIRVDGKPQNIEYNARWGDPECQAVLPSVQSDYAELVLACLDGSLDRVTLLQDDLTRGCVVGASRGYPNDYSAVKGKRIFGLEEAAAHKGVTVFGAGISGKEGHWTANGGRLFNVVGEGRDVLEARQRAYAAIACIGIEGNNLHYRTDIGWRDVERQRGNFL
jgi:phosphoribosylamine--glycine ligase